MWPNSPPKPWAPRNSSPSMTMPPPTPTSPKTQMKLGHIAARAQPVLGERCEVRLVLDADGKRPDPGAELVGDGDVRPAEVRRAEQRAGLRLGQAGQRDRQACDDQVAIGRDPRAPPTPCARGGRARDRATSASCRRGRGARSARARSRSSDADGEVVDVDLEADRDDAVVELERLRGPPDAARALVLAGLARAARARSARRRGSRRCPA